MKSLRLLRGGHMKSLKYFWYTTTRIRGLSGLWPVCTVMCLFGCLKFNSSTQTAEYRKVASRSTSRLVICPGL